MTSEALLLAGGLWVQTPGGRPLIRDLDLSMGREKIAVVGRNGAGKSTLLDVLAGVEPAHRGSLHCSGRRLLVRQQLDRKAEEVGGGSPGETRRAVLQAAQTESPDLLLLDEPTQDLDRDGVDWLLGWIGAWKQGLLVVTHHRALLRSFQQFFIVAESGCRAFRGSFDALLEDMEHERAQSQKTYVQNLNRLMASEKRNAAVASRRQRKKNLGRAREVKRNGPRILLNTNRGYAQESQGKRAVLQKQRIGAARAWAKATRRALSIELPLEVVIPEVSHADPNPVVCLERVAARVGSRTLFQGVDLELGSRDRVAITGSNGAGKTTLLEILTRERDPSAGKARADRSRMGLIAQNATDWSSDESLLLRLSLGAGSDDLDAVAELLQAHRFPFALAERPLASLSPGERVRAALICLFQRRPAVEFLVLDEPTDQLDFVGMDALQTALQRWRGGLCVVSHDEEFLAAIGVDRRLELGSSDDSVREFSATVDATD